MLSALTLSALVGFSAVSATPIASDAAGYGDYGNYGKYGSYGSYGGSSSGSPPPSSGQVTFKFPLQNGFPNIKVPSDALTAVQKQAHGTLPNGALPSKISDATAVTLQLIAFNEIFEVAYFNSLLSNLTQSGGSYATAAGQDLEKVTNAITAIQAQEQLHALGANAVLANAGRTPIQPCEYKFPVSDFASAITLAATFTDVVLGTLQAAQANFATTGDAALVPLFGSVIGQEGEQNGFYRTIGLSKLIPSQLPFLTRSSPAFAFSALNQLFVVPGSCPNANLITVPILPALTVLTTGLQANKDQTVQFSFSATGTVNAQSLNVAYVNQQNTPVVVKAQNVKQTGNTVTLDASFPGEKSFLSGLVIAAVTESAGPFADPDAVAAAAKWGPGLIELN